MKTLKKIKITAILLFVAIIILTSFLGLYKKEDFRVVNLIKGYKLGMQFTNRVVLKATPDLSEKEVIYDKDGNVVEDDGKTEYTEENGYTKKTEKVNNEEILTQENYKLTKQILKKRLKGLDVGEYKLTLNEESGDITIELQENDDVHQIEKYLEQKGVLTIIDKETEEILLDNSDVKSAKVIYGASQTDTTSTTIYLQIDFNKDGAKKLEEISQKYIAQKVQEENENGEMEEKENIKYVSVVLDGQTYSSTYFGEKMSTGVLYVPITQAKDSETLTKYVKELNKVATVINNGVLPIEYSFTEDTAEASISQNALLIGIAVSAGILLIACIVLIFKFKAKGFIATFIQAGYIALVLLAVRYTNVVITLEGIAGIIVSAMLNYALTYIMLNNLKKKGTIEWRTIGNFALTTIPIYIAAVILAFNSLTRINSLGMTVVWGSLCLYIYNLAITKNVLKMLK